MNTIYTEIENDEYRYPFRDRKLNGEFPRIATKGNLTAFIQEVIEKPNGRLYRALLFKDDKFIKSVNVKNSIISNIDALENLFEKEFN